jgi:hypothetical protein
MIDTTRERVTQYVLDQLEQATPPQRERLIRLIIARLSRQVIDGMAILTLYSESSNNTTQEQDE